jgi:hypothetical protein
MLVSYGTLKRFGVPTVITIEQRQEYLDMISAHDSDALSKLIEDVVSTEKKRQVIFDHQSSLDLHPSTYNEDKTKEEDELEM